MKHMMVDGALYRRMRWTERHADLLAGIGLLGVIALLIIAACLN